MNSRRMPTGIHTAFLFVFFVLLNFAPATANIEDCSYCGPADLTPWNQGTVQRLACYGDCVVEVHYRFRECANGYYEFALDGFTPITTGACDGINIGDLVRTSGIGSLLDYAHILFNIPSPEQGYYVCVLMPSCMEQDPNTGEISGCSTSCCKNCYNLYYDTNLQRVMVNGADNPTTVGTVNCTGDCRYICDAMEIDFPNPVYTPCELGCSPCGDMDPTPFTPAVVSGCYGHCNLTVNFEWRTCASGEREMRLTSFCVADCVTDENLLIQAAMGLILQQANTLFNIPNPDTQPYTIWYSQPSCMAWDQTDGCFKACGDGCCSKAYDLLLDLGGYVYTFSQLGLTGHSGNQNCTGTINGAPCLNRCSTLDLPLNNRLTFDCGPGGECSEDCYWTLEGNAGTDPSVNFLGTTDNVDLVVRTNNLKRMRIRNSGQVGINNDAPNLDADLHVGTDNNSRIRIGTIEYIEDGLSSIILNPNAPNGIGDVSPAFDCVTDLGTGDMRWDNLFLCGQVWTTSDMHNKSEIESLAYGLDHILALNPVSYKLMDGHDTPRLGLLAQEVQSIIPEVVYDPAQDVKLDEEGNPVPGWLENANMGLAYQDLIPVLVKAIQEQQARIQALEAGNDTRLGTSVNDRAAFGDILLEQNQPNPFADETTVAYFVPAALDGQVELLVQDMSGQEVLPRFSLQTGAPTALQLDATQLPSGVYVYGIAVQGQMVISKKLMLIR